MKKLYYTWKQFDRDTSTLAINVLRDGWKPNVIIALVRGGTVLGTVLSHRMNVYMTTLDIRLRDTSPLYPGPDSVDWIDRTWLHSNAQNNVLIVDDINDSGATFQHITDRLNRSSIQNGRLRFATLFNNLGSKFQHVEYTVNELEPENKPWIVFPWEN